MRSSLDKTKSLTPLHTLSAWAVEHRIVLGECDVDGKSNEIVKIPELLRMLEIKGAIVTIDAMGCQKHIADKIVKRNRADYVLALKKNQKQLYEEVALLFKCAEYNKDIRAAYYQTKEKIMDAGKTESASVPKSDHGSELSERNGQACGRRPK